MVLTSELVGWQINYQERFRFTVDPRLEPFLFANQLFQIINTHVTLYFQLQVSFVHS